MYRGTVELYQDPYTEKQKGEDNNYRNVWMFPLRLKSGDIPLDEKLLRDCETKKENYAKRLSLSELKEKIKDNQSNIVSIRTIKNTAYIRNSIISEYSKRRANGKCQLCNIDAPFNDKQGKPYLETHHIKWLSQGGNDTIENTVALCPNCHRKMHILDLMNDKEKLEKIAKKSI